MVLKKGAYLLLKSIKVLARGKKLNILYINILQTRCKDFQ